MLTYCLNIHRGETWAENFATLRTTVLAVRDLVSPGEPFGLGMRLGAAAAEALNIAELRAFLESENLFAFTINGFPYGRFHGGAVKENVYAPDWRSPLRRDYTNRLADILTALTPDTGTISTVPCSWKAWRPEIPPMLDHLTDCVAHLATAAKNILLTLEPEPGCLLETTGETIEFFTHHLFRQGAAMLAGKLGVAESEARELIRHHLGVCLDTCHAALQFEDPLECLHRYEAAGIRVPKIQISSALRTDISTIDALRPFVEPVYLHQVKARTGTGEILGWTDLPQALDALPASGAREVRVHFHVPLHYPGDGPLQSTGTLLTPEFLRHICRDPANHLEIETYTWDVLPPALRSTSIEESIAAEFRWVRSTAS
ncbi:MAG TPA: metabolite traffic protein EboE [Chthoniobacteraceae bacterium]|nr:metabolite traffic protein EboE [Chthoniobacteraceae bacterium]